MMNDCSEAIGKKVVIETVGWRVRADIGRREKEKEGDGEKMKEKRH